MNEKLIIRIITGVILFFLVFNLATVLSYYLLPNGFLLNKNSVLDWETSKNLLVSSLQILLFNIISVVLIFIANCFPFPNRMNPAMSLGYWCLITQYVLNGITLGTWSFTAVFAPPPELLDRVMRTFDLSRAGIWEMAGQLLITCATARMAISKQNEKNVYTNSFKKIKLSKQEAAVIVIGLFLMLSGAIIESYNIINLL